MATLEDNRGCFGGLGVLKRPSTAPGWQSGKENGELKERSDLLRGLQ
jgi:hypothetical protein